jgi:hypothetical protein
MGNRLPNEGAGMVAKFNERRICPLKPCPGPDSARRAPLVDDEWFAECKRVGSSSELRPQQGTGQRGQPVSLHLKNWFGTIDAPHGGNISWAVFATKTKT